jgi:protein-S-isoprenylcysteine O-methyltransferase Ste14
VVRWISPPVALVIAAIAMWWTGQSTFGRFSFPHQRWAGGAVMLFGLVIVAASLRLFVKARTTPNPMQPRNASELVTSGVYRVSRNPMYLGDAVMLIGIAVWLGSLPSLLCVAAFVAYIDRFQIPSEEAALDAIFGERYVAYRRRVRRWL